MPALTVDAGRFERDGFLVVPGMLPPARIEALRRDVRAASAGATVVGGGRVAFDPGASLPGVRALFTESTTLSIARQLVGDPVMDLHQSAVHFGPVNRGWHKDCADYMQGNSEGPDWCSDYRIVHFAWYLQDHADHAGGISFRRGSQQLRSAHDGEVVTPAVRAGDLVIFDLRTTHFGNTIRLRAGRRAVFLDRLWRLPKVWPRWEPWAAASAVIRTFPRIFMPDHGADRVALFAMYGADDAHTRRFFDWMRTQPDLATVLQHEAPTKLG